MTELRNCNLCGKPIVLIPTAGERAKKYGETPQYYTDLFRMHTNCTLALRHKKAPASGN